MSFENPSGVRTKDLIIRGGLAGVIALFGAAAAKKAIENGSVTVPFFPKPIVVPVNPNAKTSFTNSEIVDSNTKTLDAPHPPGVNIQPSLTINTTQLRTSYDLKKVNAEKEASVFIIGTKPASPDSSIKKTIKFDLVKLDGQYRVDLGDKTLRKFSKGASFDYINERITVSLQVEMPDNKNTPPIESSSFIKIVLNETPPSDRILAENTLENPFTKLKIDRTKIKRIEVNDPVNKRTIIFDEEFVKNGQGIDELIGLFQKMGENQPPTTPTLPY